MSETHPLVSLVNTNRYEEDLENTITRVRDIAAASSAHAPEAEEDIEEATQDLTDLMMESRSPSRKDLRDRVNAIGDKAKNRLLEILRDQFDPNTQVKIGTVITTVPPDSILIQEQKVSEWHHGLRSQSHYQIKTGKGSIRISFPIQFPNLRSINEELRHIVGQFRTSPITTLESRYIYDAVHGKLTDERPPEANNLMVERLFTVLTQENKKRLDLKDFIETVCGITVDFDIGSLPAKDVREQVRALRTRTGDTVGPVFLLNADRIEKDLQTITSLEAEKQELTRSTARNAVQAPKLTIALPIVPVVFDAINISSVPGFPYRLEAECSFYVFNHVPYTNHILFRDVLGGWTPSIDRCLLWRNYYTGRMASGDLNLKPMRRTEASSLSLLYPVIDEELQSATAKVPADQYRYPNIRDVPREQVIIPIGGSVPASETSWYVQSISIGMNYILPRLPVLSGQYPVFQAMGSAPARATMRIMVKHDDIGRIHTIKRSIDRLMLDSGGRAKRAAFLEIRDPLLELTGYRQWQLDNITTYTVDPEWSSVEMSLTSFNFPKDEKPKLIESKGNRTTYARIRNAWKRIFELAQDYEDSLERILSANKTFLQQRDAIEKLAGTPEEQAWRLLFEGSDSLVSTDLITALFSVHPHAFTTVLSILSSSSPGLFGTNALLKYGITGPADVEVLGLFGNSFATRGLADDIQLSSSVRTPGNIAEFCANLLKSRLPQILGIGPSRSTPNFRSAVDDPNLSSLRPFLLEALQHESIIDYILPRTNQKLTEARTASSRFSGEPVVLRRELELLVSVVIGDKKFGSLSDKLRTENERQDTTDQTNPYPDLNLPTYSQVHRDYIEALKSAYDSADLKGVAEKFSSDLGISANNLVRNWIETLPGPFTVNGANTLADDGRSDVSPENATRAAFKADQRCDPDFYFYSIGNKEVLDEIVEGTILPAAAEFQFGTFRKIEEEIKTALHETSKEAEVRTSPHYPNGKSKTREPVFQPEIGRPALNPFSEEYATQTDLVTSLKVYNPNASGQLKQFLERSIQSVKDDRHRMSKFFPTYQLFFIHEENGLLVRYSDWYGYNAIIDLNVTRHKWQPDVAQFTIANPLGYLDETRFNPRTPEERIKLTQDQNADTVSRKYRGDRIQDPADSDKIDALILREGVRIVIKMGYSSRTEALETVFTGKIAELQQGDVINVVAQGYAGELGFPVQVSEEINLDTLWKLFKVRLGINTSRPHKILTLIHEILSRQPTENLGDWGLGDVVQRSKLFDDSGNLIVPPDEEGRNLLTRLSGESRIGRIIRALFTDPKLENVGGLWATSLTKDFVGDNLLDLKNKWTLEPDMTGLQILRELTLMFPGHICTVLPYDERATLYFGRPESYYYNTASGNRDRSIAAQELSQDIEPQLIDEFFDRLLDGIAPRTDFEIPDTLRQFIKMVEEFRVSGEYYNAVSYSQQYDLYLQASNDAKAGRILSFAEPFLPKGNLREQLDSDKARADNLISEYARYLGDEQSAEVLIRLLLASVDIVDSSLGVAEAKATVLTGSLLHPEDLANINFRGFLLVDLRDLRALWDNSTTSLPSGINPRLSKYKVTIRRLLLAFLDYIADQSKLLVSTQALRSLYARRENNRQLILEGSRPIRKFHFVDSIHDIIANNIIATRGVMKNIIRLKGPGVEQDWKTVAIDDDLKISDYLIGHVRSPNADRSALMYLAGYGNLAEAMRPMYRGELIIRGNPDIKPHDLVFLYDICNKMWGPIEVERITHSFSYETGFTSTITPHLYCTATNEVDWASTTLTGMAIGTAGALVIGASALLAAPALAGALGFGLVTKAASAFVGYNVAKDAGDWIAQTLAGSDVYGLICGRGFIGREENPVVITPLVLNGEPFVAAMNGFERDGKYVGLKIFNKKLQWLKRGAARTLNDISIGMEKISDGATKIMDVGQ